MRLQQIWHSEESWFVQAHRQRSCQGLDTLFSVTCFECCTLTVTDEVRIFCLCPIGQLGVSFRVLVWFVIKKKKFPKFDWTVATSANNRKTQHIFVRKAVHNYRKVCCFNKTAIFTVSFFYVEAFVDWAGGYFLPEEITPFGCVCVGSKEMVGLTTVYTWRS